MILIDGIKLQVFIKLIDKESAHTLFRDISGRAEYKYPNGKLSIVNIDMAGMGTMSIRVANLPPEVLLESLASIGKMLNMHAKTWAKMYRYPVSSGVPQFVMYSTRHLPSYMTIARCTVLLSYEGQPATYEGWNFNSGNYLFTTDTK